MRDKSTDVGSRVDTVARELRRWIFEGRVQPGAPLRELVIARELSVSQATVRDALLRLEHAGLVTRKPNQGTLVTRLSPADIRERVALRVMLEKHAAQEASSRMTAAEFAELERRLQVLGDAVESDRYYEAAQADLDFHRYIWQCSGNQMLCQLLELVTVPLFAFISILRSQGLQKLRSVVEAHEPLIHALRNKNVEQIHTVFEQGAASSYQPYLFESSGRVTAEALGILGR